MASEPQQPQTVFQSKLADRVVGTIASVLSPKQRRRLDEPNLAANSSEEFESNEISSEQALHSKIRIDPHSCLNIKARPNSTAKRIFAEMSTATSRD